MSINSIDLCANIPFSQNLLNSLSAQQKKVAAIAAGVFLVIALVCYFYRFGFKATPLLNNQTNSPAPTNLITTPSIDPTNTTISPPSPRPCMQIFIKYLTGKTESYDVSPTDTVENLKKKIQDRDNINPNDMQLLFAGKRLINNQDTLADYHIQKQSTLHFVLKLAGD